MLTEVETLTRFFAAINRFDIDAIGQYFAPDVLRAEPEGLTVHIELFHR
ncbi:hypothetical protein LQ564_10980 [Massilia sp. G4R7]|uniref:Nuclear transport factor 2 family protein n=1 Tax=Massilia phyllostachyos TaxID=2898585 RepID=A0ABS8Q6Z1_9BURK|nr:hypothetical protein [Massilia phyllostachyos]MCD2516832.1 hypothetical protein [Massilia phyllostachyos]